MNTYKTNIQDYIPLDYLEEQASRIGGELFFLPAKETEANFCKLESVRSTAYGYLVVLAIENEWTGERYKKTYQVKEGSEIEMNMLLPNLACFLPPTRIPVLAKITALSLDGLSLKPVGILEAYAADFDKNTADNKTNA